MKKYIRIGKKFMIYISNLNRYNWDKSDFSFELNLGVFKSKTEYCICLTILVLMIQFVYKRECQEKPL